MNLNFKNKLHAVKAFFFDVDGVLTDGTIMAMPDGDLLRSMNIRDGYAMKLAFEKGYHVIIISGGSSNGVTVRLNKLGLTDVFLSVVNKREVFEKVIAKHQLTNDEILYMGDDMPDMEVIQMAGVPTCPSDAVPQIKSKCIYVSGLKGGKGCVRDVIEQVLTLHGKWE
jgi:3-deoxy-D-manno-octulosonate 8-phosphate phosphatase (KDO 8-P phosphatase)